ncbi:MAG TPA: hypothetical protein VJ989_10095 [Solirubrobacterales bacterium]|nr:hypothetical protein [Solirubrobacterales bacterium]
MDGCGFARIGVCRLLPVASLVCFHGRFQSAAEQALDPRSPLIAPGSPFELMAVGAGSDCRGGMAKVARQLDKIAARPDERGREGMAES